MCGCLPLLGRDPLADGYRLAKQPHLSAGVPGPWQVPTDPISHRRQLVLEEQEQQLLVEQEQQLEQEQLELDHASSTDSSVISSISNVALSRTLSSSLSSADMAILSSVGCPLDVPLGTDVPRTVARLKWARTSPLLSYFAASRIVPVTIPRTACRSIVVVSTKRARVPSASSRASASDIGTPA